MDAPWAVRHHCGYAALITWPARWRYVGVGSCIAAGLAAASWVTWLATQGRAYIAVPAHSIEPAGPEATARQERAQRQLTALAPRGQRIEIDSYSGRLRVFDGERLLREAIASAGSGMALRDPRNGRMWVFETPVGERRVERKVTDPVWTKPDWAFVEEGVLPPPMGHPERYDSFSLGDYALYLGDGYLIHGTLFQTTLGSRVTHGCIRLGDEDLAWIYHNVPLGARVWIY